MPTQNALQTPARLAALEGQLEAMRDHITDLERRIERLEPHALAIFSGGPWDGKVRRVVERTDYIGCSDGGEVGSYRLVCIERTTPGMAIQSYAWTPLIRPQ